MAGEAADPDHSGQSPDSGAAVEAHQHRLGLIVEMVSGQESPKLAVAQPGGERSITNNPGLLLDRARRRKVPLDREGRMRNA